MLTALLSSPHRWRWLLLLTIVSLLVLAVMASVSLPLENSVAEWGIVSLQLAGSAEAATAILASWSPDDQLRAAFSLGIDFLFLVLYAATISLACLLAAPVAGMLHYAGIGLAAAQWLAAGLDVVENLVLLEVLLGSMDDHWLWLVAWMASIKFLLVFAGLAYAFTGILLRLVVRRTGQSR